MKFKNVNGAVKVDASVLYPTKFKIVTGEAKKVDPHVIQGSNANPKISPAKYPIFY